MRRLTALMAAAFFLVLPGLAMAQASITGTVRDASGAVLPGVDRRGRQSRRSSKRSGRRRPTAPASTASSICRPGTYTVTFTLAGLQPGEARRHRAHGVVHRHRERRHASRRRGGDRDRDRRHADRRRAKHDPAARLRQRHHRRGARPRRGNTTWRCSSPGCRWAAASRSRTSAARRDSRRRTAWWCTAASWTRSGSRRTASPSTRSSPAGTAARRRRIPRRCRS